MVCQRHRYARARTPLLLVSSLSPLHFIFSIPMSAQLSSSLTVGVHLPPWFAQVMLATMDRHHFGKCMLSHPIRSEIFIFKTVLLPGTHLQYGHHTSNLIPTTRASNPHPRYSQGCFIGCKTCDHVSGRRQTDLCGAGFKATNNAEGTSPTYGPTLGTCTA